MKNEQNKWRSRKKLIDASKVLKQPEELKAFKYNESDDNEKCLKYKETFDELSNERIGEIHNISKQIDFNNLIYYFKDENISPINLIGFRALEVQCIFIII